MNPQPAVQPRSSANGFARRRVERDSGSRSDNKSQTGKPNSSRLSTPGVPIGNKGGGGYESPSRERLVYLTTCLIGHHVEVQVNDGSVYSGIFHATNAERDFGIILKMARLTKAGSSPGQKNISDSVSKPPSKTFIIKAKDLVQLTAKSVSVTSDGTNEFQREKQQEIMIDSSISQSYHADAERELERWVPDEDNPECPELENIFDDPWNRGWDQFEANETLFGVKSTFNEELYTTKLDRGPQTRELEREALRIAREIECEDTKDMHLAEERGIQLHGSLELDEETRYSSVLRGVDDSGYDETEDVLLDSHNIETFGSISDHSVISKSITDLSIGKTNDRAQLSSSSSYMDEIQSSQSSAGRNLSGSNDHAKLLPAELLSRSVSALGGESSSQGNRSTKHNGGSNYSQESIERQTLAEDAQTSKTEDPESSSKKENIDKGGLSPNASAYAPSGVSSKDQEKPSSSWDSSRDVKTQGVGTHPTNSRAARPASSTSSSSFTSDSANAAAALPSSNAPTAQLSRTSSVASLTSSTLNPHAKEFKLNPNAKSFVPSKTPLRPASPVADGSFYYPPTVQQLHNMPIGVGIGPSFPAHQSVMFNPQAAHMQPPPQPYFYPNTPQYGQQMMLGQSRPVVYMPNYPSEMQYKGREF